MTGGGVTGRGVTGGLPGGVPGGGGLRRSLLILGRGLRGGEEGGLRVTLLMEGRGLSGDDEDDESVAYWLLKRKSPPSSSSDEEELSVVEEGGDICSILTCSVFTLCVAEGGTFLVYFGGLPLGVEGVTVASRLTPLLAVGGRRWSAGVVVRLGVTWRVRSASGLPVGVEGVCVVARLARVLAPPVGFAVRLAMSQH